MTLGERIRMLRKKKGFKQEDLGKKLTVVKSTISQYENNINTPDIDKLQKLAKLFDVSLDYLLFGNNQSDLFKNIKKIIDNDSELEKLIRHLAERKDLQDLLKETKKLSPGEVKKIVQVIKIITDQKQ